MSHFPSGGPYARARSGGHAEARITRMCGIQPVAVCFECRPRGIERFRRPTQREAARFGPRGLRTSRARRLLSDRERAQLSASVEKL
jgi:hypothetical protein